LLAELNEDFTIVCPALPVNGRTVYNGHLFVFQDLLSDSGMRNHPVTPMTDSSLIRMMDAQSQGSSGLVNFQVIEQGSQAVSERFETLKQQGVRYAVVDAFNADHLVTLQGADGGVLWLMFCDDQSTSCRLQATSTALRD